MAFFKFRKTADEPASVPPAPQSVEAMRQRAKHRLVGATVLVVLGVIGFPLLFDKQPRPIAVDTPIDIPDRNKVLPLVLHSVSAPVALPALPASAVTEKTSPATVAAPSKTVVVTESANIKTPVAPVKQAASATKTKVSEATKPVASAPTKPADATKAVVTQEAAKPEASVPQAGRYVLQVGAFADATRAHEVRLKLERAGLKTYTHVADTKDGKRIRVRVGPFGDKAEANKTAEKIKKLNLPAALLTL